MLRSLSLVAVRHKEDPLEGFADADSCDYVLRCARRSAGKNALVGGVLLALIEGLGILITKMMAPPRPRLGPEARRGRNPTLQPTQLRTAPPVDVPTRSSSRASKCGRMRGCKTCWFTSNSLV